MPRKPKTHTVANNHKSSCDTCQHRDRCKDGIVEMTEEELYKDAMLHNVHQLQDVINSMIESSEKHTEMLSDILDDISELEDILTSEDEDD